MQLVKRLVLASVWAIASVWASWLWLTVGCCYVDVHVVADDESGESERLVVVSSNFAAACHSDLPHAARVRAIVRGDQREVKVSS